MKSRTLIIAVMATTALLWNLTRVLGQLPQLNPNGLDSAAVCGECHQAIHAVWRQSLHSKAWSNAVFQAGYKRTIDSAGSESAKLCLSCHAPTVLQTGDYDVADPITAEGVTCDFCHSVQDVKPGDPRPVKFNLGEVKFGPLRNAESPSHDVAASDLHTRSEFCAACHEYTNALGVRVLGTYSEWKASPYAKRGQQCQDCHMPLVPGRVVALQVKDTDRGSVNLHDISGSHDLERVRGAIKLDLMGTEWIGDRVWAFLKVSNVGSGHCFPTGLPMHRAVLEVVLRDGSRELARREIPFGLVLTDGEGRLIEREHDVFLKAAAVQIDTRLKPLEARPIEIAFREVKASRAVLSARLFYKYSTEQLVDDGVPRIEPAEMEFLVASREKTLKRPRR